MRGVANQQSLFSRHRASSVERELARTPYAFTPKPRDADEHSDILTQRLIGPDILPGDTETIKKAREQILDPFEDDINVRLAKERIFGGYSKSGSRAPSPTIFPSNTDFEKRLKQDNSFEKLLFGPNVNFDTNSNFSEKLSDTSSIRTTNFAISDNVKPTKQLTINQNNNNNVIVKRNVRLKSDTSSDKSSNLSVKTRSSTPVSPVTRKSIIRRTSDISLTIKDNKSDVSSNSSASKVTIVKAKQSNIQRTYSFDRSGSNDTGDNDSNKNSEIASPIKKGDPNDNKEPAFTVREFVHLKGSFGNDVHLKHMLSNVSEAGIEKYRQSRALAEEYTERFYKSIRKSNEGSQESTGSDEARRFSDDGVIPVTAAPLPHSEPFKVIGASQPPAADLESVSSSISSFKLPQGTRSHRATAFAILGDAVASAPAHSSETESQASSAVPAVVPLSTGASGRVSPFRGRGFKSESQSRHTTPKTSRPPSPLRSRANSLSKVEIIPKVDSRNPLVYERSPTPARNYIKENIEEVKELSEFNRERNLELAEQKQLEEEMEILKELGIVDPTELTTMAKANIRSRSGSPSALLHYDTRVPNSKLINSRDGFEVLRRRPPKVSPRNVVSLPQSKSGSPTHRSRIPKRRNSLSPPMDESDYFDEPSVMSNSLSRDGRFISNSTSSINDNRVFSVITDVDNKPIDTNFAKVRSKSSSNLMPGPSILKTKPPKSPARPGPPPSHGNFSSKRLSPIVATPDKSPVPEDSPTSDILYHGKSFSQLKNDSESSESVIADHGTKSKSNIYQKATTKKFDSKSKPGTPKVTSPTRIPKRPSKSLVTSPTSSREPSRAPTRTPSRTPSRGPAGKVSGKDPNPLKKTPSVTRFSPVQKHSYAKNTSYSGRDDRMSSRSDSKDSTETEKKYQLKRVNSRTSIASKMASTSGGKTDLKRVDSRNSIKPLTRSNSIKSMRDKPGTKRRPSMKDVEETMEESTGKGKSSSRSKPKKSTNRKETNTDDIDKHDSETQYDKTSHFQFTMDKLIPFTKTNVVSMTTAAITAQPLEIAAKVTSQLPSALEKARERGVFDRTGSSDSVAAKMLQQNGTAKTDETKSTEASKTLGESTTLQKTSSKSSINSAKDEKETLNRSDSIILNHNLKLKPIKTPLDPKVQNVKLKIDNILNSSQSSFEDIREKVKRVEKAADKSKEVVEKAAEAEKKAEEKIDDSIKKADEIVKTAEKETKTLEKELKTVEKEVKKVEEPVTKVQEKLGEVTNEVSKKEPIKVDEMKEKVKKATEEVKTPTKEAEKEVTAVLSKKSSEKGLTPVETTVKVETPKHVEPKATPSHAEIMKVKEEVIVKKETLTPTVMIVNEKARGHTSEEHTTEKIIKGEPDVEVQSGNIPMEKMMMTMPVDDTASIANGASTSNGKSKSLPPESNGSVEGSATDHKAGVSMVSAPAMDEEPGAEESGVGKKKKGCCGGKPIFPCWKSQNLSEVQLIDENIGKKRLSKSEISQASGKKSGQEMEQKQGCANRLLCCRGKNKVRDSSLPRASLAPSDATGRSMSKGTVHSMKPAPRGRCASIFCCCCKKDMPDRRDSILSQKPKQKWYKRICCCGKNSSLGASRRTSMFSKKRSLSQAVPLQEDKRPKLDNSLVEHTSMLRGAIPALHLPLAWICFVCNIIVPGLGTVLSGMFCLCFGRPRFGMYDGWKPRIGAFVIDLIVGVGQLFCVLFCLVGWGWSIWWATIMIKVARKYSKLKATMNDPETAQAPANNHRTNNNT